MIRKLKLRLTWMWGYNLKTRFFTKKLIWRKLIRKLSSSSHKNQVKPTRSCFMTWVNSIRQKESPQRLLTLMKKTKVHQKVKLKKPKAPLTKYQKSQGTRVWQINTEIKNRMNQLTEICTLTKRALNSQSYWVMPVTNFARRAKLGWRINICMIFKLKERKHRSLSIFMTMALSKLWGKS